MAAPSPPLADRLTPYLGLSAFVAELLLLGVVAGALVLAADRWLAPQNLPWRPLELDQPIGWFTAAKLGRAYGPACRAVLERGGVRFADAPARESGFCSMHDAVRLGAGGPPLRPAGPVMTCNAALALAIWERQVLQPAAREVLGARVAAIEHYGSYACRRQYGAEGGRVSEHARANAIDVAGVVLSDGRRVSVARDWGDPGPKGRFLHRIRDGACGPFTVTLSPDYNAAHADHLHFDRGGFRICR